MAKNLERYILEVPSDKIQHIGLLDLQTGISNFIYQLDRYGSARILKHQSTGSCFLFSFDVYPDYVLVALDFLTQQGIVAQKANRTHPV